MRTRRERPLERRIGRGDRRARVDVAGSPELFRQRAQRDVLGVQHAALERERAHGFVAGEGAAGAAGVAGGATGTGRADAAAAGADALAGTGNISSPFEPHPASASGNAAAAQAAPMRVNIRVFIRRV